MNDKIKPEWVERMAAAQWHYEWPDREFRSEPDDLQDFYRESSRTALAAALPDILQQAKAEALRESADDIERRINEPGLILLADKYGGFHAGERHRAQREVDLLRVRADRIEQGGRP